MDVCKLNLNRQTEYNREDAVNYAKRYALSPNPNFRYFGIYANIGGDCTNFTSQCLFAGGAPMTYSTEYAWWYNNSVTNDTLDDTWSIPWAVAHSLYWTLRVNMQNGYYGPKGLEVRDINAMELGDMIFYEGDNGIIYHSAIITSFDSSGPLISQHTFNALNISYLKTWKAKFMHFIKISL